MAKAKQESKPEVTEEPKKGPFGTPVADSNVKQLVQKKVNETRFKQAEFTRNLFYIRAERGTTMDDITDEAYWANVAYMLKPCDRVEIIPEDNSFFAEVIVIGTGKLYAQVEVLRHKELGRAEKRKSQTPYKVDWSGGHGKHRVLRGSDVIKEGFDTEKDAQRWIDSHADALSR